MEVQCQHQRSPLVHPLYVQPDEYLLDLLFMRRELQVASVKLGEIQTANVVRTEGWDAPPEVHLTVEDAGFEGINESVAEDEAELTWKFSRLGNGRHLFVQFDEGGNPPDKDSLENSNPVGLANTEMLYNMPAVLRHGDKRLCISSLHYEVLDLSQTGIARQDTFEKYEDSVYIGTFQDLLDSSQYAFVVENVVYQPYSDHVLLTTQRNNAILIERDMSGGLTVDWFVGREGYAKIGFEDGVFDVADYFLSFQVGVFPVFFVVNTAFVLVMILLLVYWAGPQDVQMSRPILGFVPRRLVGISVVSFLTAAALMTMWGRVDAWEDPVIAVARVSVVWTVASFGAALGDILPGESSGDDINDDLAALGDFDEEPASGDRVDDR